MHILVINGSPKGKGNTYRVAQKLEEAMKEIDNQIEFEYLHLKDVNLKSCTGCYRCLAEGEDKCPLQDDQKKIEEEMHAADGIVFATPVYVANVSGLFKNFIDRFAYICHRPRFHGKKAMVLSSTGSLAAGIVNIITKISVQTWGFEVVSSLGAVTSPFPSQEQKMKEWSKITRDTKKVARRFYKALTSTQKIRASFFKLYAFNLQKTAFDNPDIFKADYAYWKNQGWLEDESAFYIDAKINPVTRWFANRFASVKKNR